MRAALYAKLIELKTPGSWEHIVTQIGMFSYLGINGRFPVFTHFLCEFLRLLHLFFFVEKQSQYLTDKHHVFLLKSGRISVCGLNSKNVDYVASAIHDAVINQSKL
jgi:aspartate aminotransferase